MLNSSNEQESFSLKANENEKMRWWIDSFWWNRITKGLKLSNIMRYIKNKNKNSLPFILLICL